MADKKAEFIAQWRIEGLAEKPLEAGDVIALTEAEAEPFVKGGSLKVKTNLGRKPRGDGQGSDQ